MARIIPPVTDRNEDGSFEPTPFFTYGEPCENCGAACDAGTRVHVPGFDFMACDTCATEAALTIFAEQTCPALYDFILRSKSVQEIQRAYHEHERSCPNCLRVVRKVAKWQAEEERERAA